MSGIDTVVSDAVSGGLCDLDSVSGSGDTGVGGVDTVVSDDLDSVSGGDIVVRVGDMSLSGGGDAAMLGVGRSVCGVNPVLADGTNLCGTDTVVSSVDEPVCDDSSAMTAGEFDLCACDSVVSGGAGNSSGVEVVDDVFECGDEAVLPDAFRVGGWLSVVELGVAQPGWVDGLVCADDSLRPSLHRCTQCVCVVVYNWQLPDLYSGHGDCLCL